jgi:hypothetical protein
MTQAPATVDPPLDPFIHMAGLAAMALRSRSRLVVHDGGRRRFGEKTPRPAVDLKIVRGKDQPCP